jgi:adenylate cyclase
MNDAVRKLATIVALDVAGYSARTEADEAKTTAEIAALRQVIEGIAARHGGRVFNTAGDGFMLEFGSSLAAVEAAFALAETCEPQVRVGVHLGDVVVQPNGDLLGHGVNVAARLMAQSLPGAALISGAVRSTIRGPIAERLQSRGHLKLEKMAETIEAFGLGEGGVATAKADASRKVSVCVLAFSNISDDPQQEYFSDGISEDIITDLSKVSALGVTARNTSFQFKGKSVDVPTIARQLKVSHVLEGSVRKAGSRVRITAQLIDGASGEHIWAERYDRDLSDIFALQDEISQAIVTALKLKLLPEEKKAIERRGTNNTEAYNLFLLARHVYLRGSAVTSRTGDSVVRLCTAAVKLDPNYARAWGTIALSLAIRATLTGKRSEEAAEAAERAIALDPSSAEGHAARARLLANRGAFEAAIAEVETALREDPDSAEVYLASGIIYGSCRRLKEAITCFERAAVLLDSGFLAFVLLMSAHVILGNRDKARRYAELALPRAQAALAREVDDGGAMGALAFAYAVLDEPERTKELFARGMMLDPANETMKAHFMRAAAYLGDDEVTFAMLETALETASRGYIMAVASLPEFARMRDTARYKALMAAAEKRLADGQRSSTT